MDYSKLVKSLQQFCLSSGDSEFSFPALCQRICNFTGENKTEMSERIINSLVDLGILVKNGVLFKLNVNTHRISKYY